jgi:hypothetical protein
MSRSPDDGRSYPGLALALIAAGTFCVVVSAEADALGLDLTPGFGLLQTVGVLVAITLLTAGGFRLLARWRRRGQRITLVGDIGVRMALTGLLTCYVAGLADVLGVGTHRGSEFERPFLGPLQLGGFVVGLLVTGTGLLLYWVGIRQERPEGDEPSS